VHVAAVSSSIEIGEEGCATLLALGVYTAFSALSVFLEGEKKKTLAHWGRFPQALTVLMIIGLCMLVN